MKYPFVLFAPFPLDWAHFLDNNYLRGMLARTPLLFCACIPGCIGMEGCVPALPEGQGWRGVCLHCQRVRDGGGVSALPDVVDGSGSEVLVTGLGDGPCGDIH